ncbi:MAG: hypothetical protein QOG68_2090 [Solirubrobacteraceae bacterium]|nr:hypothetical protein [Solirubrobacteraceae bacterium]
MIRAAALAATLLAAVVLSACESTQDKAAKVRAAGEQALAGRKGLRITQLNKDVSVTGKTILHDANGTAVVVELVNKGKQDEAQVPIGIELTDAKGKKMFANDAPGLEPALVSMPLLPRDKDSFWVHNQIIATGVPAKLAVKVGLPKTTDVPAKPPHITLSDIKLDHDDSGAFVTGQVHNRSSVLQKRVTIFCIAKKGGKIIAAGRGVVDKLPPSPTPKPIRFSVYFIGNPAGGTLHFTVPPVVLR